MKRLPSLSPNFLPFTQQVDELGIVEHLFDALPPSWLSINTALRTLNERLLVTVRHLPPLLYLWILPHFLHIARPVVADVLEACEKDARSWVVEDGICLN
jgi:hypothetical protein